MHSTGSVIDWSGVVSSPTSMSPAAPRMKVLAARRRDGDDIGFLIRRLGLVSVDQVLAVCAEVFPDEPVPERARLILEDVFDRNDQGQGNSEGPGR